MNFDLVLSGNKEFYPGLNNKTYNVLKTDTPDKIRWMINFIERFHKHEIIAPFKKYIGIDFEFNKVGRNGSDIALMQINLESDDSTEGHIFILYPPELSPTQLSILINLMTDPTIIKILHGAESLDVPYMFKQLFRNKDQIINFCENFYDTKFLCDYANAQDKKKERCSIYYLLANNNIITKAKFDILNSIEPIYNQYINIHKMTRTGLEYSLYDVLYLPETIKKYMGKGTVYNKIIQQVTSLLYKNKHGVDTIFDEINQLINSKNTDLNSKYIHINKKMITLHEIWECYYYFISDTNNYLTFIKEVDHFKNFIKVLTKLIVYTHVFEQYTVSKSKGKNIYLKSNQLSQYFSRFAHYPELNSMIRDYYTIVGTDIKRMITTLSKKKLII
jgi:hypothetical protein